MIEIKKKMWIWVGIYLCISLILFIVFSLYVTFN